MPMTRSTAAGAQTALFNLDDLGDLGDADDTSCETAGCILDEETREFFAWLNYRAALPLIAKIKSAAVTVAPCMPSVTSPCTVMA